MQPWPAESMKLSGTRQATGAAAEVGQAAREEEATAGRRRGGGRG
jgi:hypothetical protein